MYAVYGVRTRYAYPNPMGTPPSASATASTA